LGRFAQRRIARSRRLDLVSRACRGGTWAPLVGGGSGGSGHRLFFKKNLWAICYRFAMDPVGCLAPLTSHGSEESASWASVTHGPGGGGGGAASARVPTQVGGLLRASPLLLCFRPALVARGNRSGWGCERPAPLLYQARLPLLRLLERFSSSPGRPWRRGGGHVRPQGEPAQWRPLSGAFGDSALHGVSSAPTSVLSCRCYSRPQGWPRRDRHKMRELLLPLREDLP
jgi:hypothetical protein